GRHDVRMRIWERGAGEALASGSGSCAVAVAALRTNLAQSPVSVYMYGGAVQIEWSGDGEPVYIEGPAEYVCEGELSLQTYSSSQGSMDAQSLCSVTRTS